MSFFIASSERPLAVASVANDLLALAHKWPKVEVVVDGKTEQLSNMAETTANSFFILLHAAEVELLRKGKGEVCASISPINTVAQGNASGRSSFNLTLSLSSDEGRIEMKTDFNASIPAAYTAGEKLATSSWGNLLTSLSSSYELAPPNSLIKLEKGGCEVKREEVNFPVKRYEKEVAASLAELICKAVKDNVVKRRCAVLFSGGLDSSVLLKVALDEGLEPIAVTVGLKGSHDIKVARNTAIELGADYVIAELEREDITRAALYLTRLMGKTSLMDLSIATVIYLAAEEVRKMGKRQVVAGQGADELFGGYYKYIVKLKNEGPVLLNVELRNDALNLWRTSVHRDYAAAVIGGCILTLPYMERDFFSYALELPLDHKVKGEERKMVLREVAKLMGLSEEIANRPKKAAQYGSGIEKVISLTLNSI